LIFSAFSRDKTTAVAVLPLLQIDIHRVAHLGRDVTGWRAELPEGDEPFRLVANVHEDHVLSHLQDRPFHDVAFGDVPQALLVDLSHFGRGTRRLHLLRVLGSLGICAD
jgi:hypothetical protein